MTLLIVLFLSMSLSLVATPILISKFKKSGIVDLPSGRKQHSGAIPRMGGIVILLSVLIIIFSFYSDLSQARGFIYGLFIISICGIIDDITGLKWSFKFLFQTISAIIILYALNISSFQITIFYIQFPHLLSILILIIFIVGLINSINLMDGLDGLVAGYSISKFIVLLFLAILASNSLLVLILVSVIGSLIGFLKYNANPAKIFLGDTGSLILGFILSYSVLALSPVNNVNSDLKNLDLSFAIILLSLPLIDTLKVLMIRIVKKSNPFSPDRIHLHHIIFGQKIKHKNVVFSIHIYSLFFIISALLYLKYSHLFGIISWIVFSLLLLNTKTIICNLHKWSMLVNINKLGLKLSDKILNNLKKVLIILSFIPSAIILSYSLLAIRPLNKTFVFPLVVVGVLLLLAAIYNNKRNEFLKTFYIYINFVLFFVIVFFERSSSALTSYSNSLLFYSSITMLLLLILFLLLKKEMESVYKVFFSGFDLSIIVLTISIFIIEKFMFLQNLTFLVPTLLYSIIFYFWFMVLIDLYKKYSDYFFYSSFSLPLVALIISVI